MSSRRSSIRKAFAELLTGLPTTGTHVFTSRTRQLRESELPALLVFSGTSDPDEAGIGTQKPAFYTYRLRADIYVKESGDAEAVADTVLDEVLEAVFASQAMNTLSGAVHGIRLVQTGEPDLDDSLEKPAVRLPVLFETTYST